MPIKSYQHQSNAHQDESLSLRHTKTQNVPVFKMNQKDTGLAMTTPRHLFQLLLGQ